MSCSSWLVRGADQAVDASRTRRIVALGGDGIGPEVVGGAIRALEVCAPRLQIETPLHGEAAVRELGTAFPDAAKEQISRADAVLFGACDTSSSGFCRPILRYLRFGLEAYANVRPAASLPGIPAVTGKPGTNLVIVRELTEDMYPGCEGDLAELNRRWPGIEDRAGRTLPEEGKFALRVITERASRRVARYAGRLARHRKSCGVGPGHVTIVGKANVLVQTEKVFQDAAAAELADIDGVTWSSLYVDEAARRLVAQPETFDVILTTNLFGDILSDVAAEVMGGLPIAPSAAVGERIAYFEPCHGSGPTIAGKGIANPSAAILSAAMMLTYLGEDDSAQRLMDALLATVKSGYRTPDMGGSHGTLEFADAIRSFLIKR